MPNISNFSIDPEQNILEICFHSENHYLTFETFFSTSIELSRVLENFNHVLFQDTIEFQLVILPPKEGSFIKRIGVAIGGSLTGIALLLQIADSPTFNKLLEEITGENVNQHVEKFFDDIGNNNLSEKSDSQLLQASSDLLLGLSQDFLASPKTAKILRNAKIDEFYDALDARNNFFSQCFNDQNVEAISFQTLNESYISRQEFIERQINLPDKDKVEKHSYFYEVADIHVPSPNWDRNDKKRKWKGKNSLGQDVYFLIEDDSFWNQAATDELHLQAGDKLKVQLIFELDGSRQKKLRVIRVLKHNDDIISKPLEAEEINKIYPNSDQTSVNEDLFSLLFKKV